MTKSSILARFSRVSNREVTTTCRRSKILQTLPVPLNVTQRPIQKSARNLVSSRLSSKKWRPMRQTCRDSEEPLQKFSRASAKMDKWRRASVLSSSRSFLLRRIWVKSWRCAPTFHPLLPRSLPQNLVRHPLVCLNCEKILIIFRKGMWPARTNQNLRSQPQSFTRFETRGTPRTGYVAKSSAAPTSLTRACQPTCLHSATKTAPLPPIRVSSADVEHSTQSPLSLLRLTMRCVEPVAPQPT